MYVPRMTLSHVSLALKQSVEAPGTQACLLTCQAGQEPVQMRSKMISNALRPGCVCKNLRSKDTTEEAKQGWNIGTPHCPKLHSCLKVLWSDRNGCLANEVDNLVLGLHERQ